MTNEVEHLFKCLFSKIVVYTFHSLLLDFLDILN